MTDLEKFEKLFDDLGIKYERITYWNYNWKDDGLIEVIKLRIDDSHMEKNYDDVDITFNTEGKFLGFNPTSL